RQGGRRQRRGLDAARQQILRNRHDVFQPKAGSGRAQAGQGPRGTLIRREPASVPTDLPSSDLLAVPARFALTGLMAALRLRDPVTAVPGETAPVVWVLHDGKPGMASQALRTAEATGFPFIERQLSVRAPWAWLPPQLWLAPSGAVITEAGPLRPP